MSTMQTRGMKPKMKRGVECRFAHTNASTNATTNRTPGRLRLIMHHHHHSVQTTTVFVNTVLGIEDMNIRLAAY